VHEAFLAALPQDSGLASEVLDALHEELSSLFEQGAGAHPGIRGAPALFAERLGRVLAADEPQTWLDVRERLRGVDVEGIYLAAACAAGQDAAIQRFEELYFRSLPGTLRSMGAQATDVDDVVSAVREKLFVAHGDTPPGVLEYSGRGSLEKLCRVIAARVLLNHQRSSKRQRVCGDEDLADLIAPQLDPELATLKQHHRDVFRAAFTEAIAKLSSEDRNLLRLSLIHRLSIDEVGRVYQMHRSTAARRLSRLKEAIGQNTRMYLRIELGVDKKQLHSLFRLVQSGLDESFIRLLSNTATGQ